MQGEKRVAGNSSVLSTLEMIDRDKAASHLCSWPEQQSANCALQSWYSKRWRDEREKKGRMYKNKHVKGKKNKRVEWRDEMGENQDSSAPRSNPAQHAPDFRESRLDRNGLAEGTRGGSEGWTNSMMRDGRRRRRKWWVTTPRSDGSHTAEWKTVRDQRWRIQAPGRQDRKKREEH